MFWTLGQHVTAIFESFLTFYRQNDESVNQKNNQQIKSKDVDDDYLQPCSLCDAVIN